MKPDDTDHPPTFQRAAAGDPADRRPGRGAGRARAPDRRRHAARARPRRRDAHVRRPSARRRRPRARRDRRREHRAARRSRHRRAAGPAHGHRGARPQPRRRPRQGERGSRAARRRSRARRRRRRRPTSAARGCPRGRPGGGGLLALFFAVGIAEALFAYDGFRELARFRASDPALLREGAPALSAIVIALLIAVGQKAAGKNLRLAHTRDPEPPVEGGRRLLERDMSTVARYAVTAAIVVCGLALWYGVQSARTTANNAAAARAQANQAAGARGAAAQRLAQNTQSSSSEPGVYFLVSSAVFLLGIGVAFLLHDPARDARERRRRTDADILATATGCARSSPRRSASLVRQRAEIATTVANAKRQMHQEAVLYPEVAFLQRADEFPHLYGTWRSRGTSPFPSMPAVGEAHHAQAELTRTGRARGARQARRRRRAASPSCSAASSRRRGARRGERAGRAARRAAAARGGPRAGARARARAAGGGRRPGGHVSGPGAGGAPSRPVPEPVAAGLAPLPELAPMPELAPCRRSRPCRSPRRSRAAVCGTAAPELATAVICGARAGARADCGAPSSSAESVAEPPAPEPVRRAAQGQHAVGLHVQARDVGARALLLPARRVPARPQPDHRPACVQGQAQGRAARSRRAGRRGRPPCRARARGAAALAPAAARAARAAAAARAPAGAPARRATTTGRRRRASSSRRRRRPRSGAGLRRGRHATRWPRRRTASRPPPSRSWSTAASRRRRCAASSPHLGSWLAANHAPGTRVSLIDAASGRASAPLSALAARARERDAAAAEHDGRRRGRRSRARAGGACSWTSEAPPPRTPRGSTLDIATRPGASAAPAVALERGGRAAVTIDERRPNALAASVARALMAISGQRERR